MRRARPFDDGGLADAGLADEHRVVLRAAAQHLDDAPDLLVAPDDRVELALAGVLGEVAPELLERLVLLLGVLARDAVAAAHRLQRVEDGFVRDAERAQRVADTAGDLRHGQEDVLGREVVVTEIGALGVGRFEHPERVGRELRLLRGLAVDLGKATSASSTRSRTVFGATPRRSSTGRTTLSGWPRSAASTCSAVTCEWLCSRQRLGRGEGLVGLAGQLVGVERHVASPSFMGRHRLLGRQALVGPLSERWV